MKWILGLVLPTTSTRGNGYFLHLPPYVNEVNSNLHSTDVFLKLTELRLQCRMTRMHDLYPVARNFLSLVLSFDASPSFWTFPMIIQPSEFNAVVVTASYISHDFEVLQAY